MTAGAKRGPKASKTKTRIGELTAQRPCSSPGQRRGRIDEARPNLCICFYDGPRRLARGVPARSPGSRAGLRPGATALWAPCAGEAVLTQEEAAELMERLTAAETGTGPAVPREELDRFYNTHAPPCPLVSLPSQRSARPAPSPAHRIRRPYIHAAHTTTVALTAPCHPRSTAPIAGVSVGTPTASVA